MRSSYIYALSFTAILNRYRLLENVLDKLNDCNMKSTGKRDVIRRVFNRKALKDAVEECGEDIRQSLETFKVRKEASVLS